MEGVSIYVSEKGCCRPSEKRCVGRFTREKTQCKCGSRFEPYVAASCLWYCCIGCIFVYYDGYEVVKTQQAVVQLTKDNDALDVEVASLKSPVRIQQIAEQQLGMVLPDSFVYSTKSAVTERNVQEKQQIID